MLMLLPETPLLLYLRDSAEIPELYRRITIMRKNRLFITGTNAFSPYGGSFDALDSSIGERAEATPVKQLGFHSLNKEVLCYRINNVDPKEILGKKGLRTKDWATKILLCTIETGFGERLYSAQDSEKPGLAIGTGFGSVQSIGDFLSDSIENGVNSVNPRHFPNTVINSPTGNANIRYHIQSLSATASTGFGSSSDALIYSCNQIRLGYYKSILTGGLEEISFYTLAGMDRHGALSKTDSVRPFSKGASETLMGEGCALFMVESEESAQVNSQEPLAEVCSYSSAFSKDKAEACEHTMQEAISKAGITPSEIDMVVSDANGFSGTDRAEADAISRVTGDKTPVACYKSMFGETYGASGSLNLACTLSDMKNSRITGIPDEYETDTDIDIVFKTREKDIGYAIINSVSPQGNCSSIIIKKEV